MTSLSFSVARMQKRGSLATFLRSIRIGCIGVGLAFLCVLAFANLREPLSSRIGFVALALLFVGALGSYAESCISAADVAPVDPGLPLLAKVEGRLWWVAPAVVAIVTQTWFGGATSYVAGGDLAPPVGTAWMAHVFAPWAAAGSSLGGPSNLEVALPFGLLQLLVRALGLPPAFAERLWCTAFYSAAAGGAYLLIRLTKRSSAAATVGALIFCLNPYTVTVVGADPLYLTALGLVPLVLAIVVASGTGRIAVSTGVICLAAGAPFIGYCYENPPLALMVAGAVPVGSIIVAGTCGRTAARRCLALCAGSALVVTAVAAYWIVPSLISNSVAAIGSLSSTSNWLWTETRATLANALWLNTTWAWTPTYFPYARSYTTAPILLLRYSSALLAFASLLLVPRYIKKSAWRGVAVTSAALIILVVLSTGTNWPGNLLFNTLYNLPLGWLLREPGRYLLFASLAYAVLTAFTLDVITARIRTLRKWSLPVTVPFAVSLFACAAIGIAFPAYTGQMIKGPQPGVYNEARVKVPEYWVDMAHYLNQSTNERMLVLPLTSYYQVGYDWGYYGTDAFVGNLIKAPIIDLSLQGYFPASNQLASAVRLFNESIVEKRWGVLPRLAAALGIHGLLLREDLSGSSAPTSRAELAALLQSPVATLRHREGPLYYFNLAVSPRPSIPVTVDTSTPDLSLLQAVPNGSALVTHPPIAGVNAAFEPPVDSWTIARSGRVTATTPYLPGRTYEALGLPANATRLGNPVRLTGTVQGDRYLVSVPAGPDMVTNGDFSKGAWQDQVGDCDNVDPGESRLGASVVPSDSGGSALELSAQHDSACEAETLHGWTGGAVLLDIKMLWRSGAAPSVCLWEIGPDHCGPLPDVQATRDGWFTYRALVEPDPGTKRLSLFLYARGGGTSLTVDDYRAVTAIPISYVPAVLATPVHPSDQGLLSSDTTWSGLWTSPSGYTRVLADGLTNAWLLPGEGVNSAPPAYRPAGWIRASEWISLGAAICIATFSGFLMVRSRRSRHAK